MKFQTALREPAHTPPAQLDVEEPIFVTKPHLPPLEDFIDTLRQIWASKVLTNGGPLHAAFEEALARYLGVEHAVLFANGTLALVTALQALRIGGEVITTPYSFVATAHALLWNDIKPVFVDVEPDTCNIDPELIESAITPATTAILGVHCYGNPCKAARIQQIADNYNLRVIYDGAHAFGVTDVGGSVLRHGDLTILSFHATKVFNTFEGGAIICPDARTKRLIGHLKNFGFVDEVTVVATGINGKMSEINAGLGLLQLRDFDSVLQRRKALYEQYLEALAALPGLLLPTPEHATKYNYSYFPVRVTPAFAISRDDLYARLRRQNIFGRRYFFPLISEFPMYRGLPSAAADRLPVATQISREVICLPLYPDMTPGDVRRVARAIASARDEANQQ
ncbi:MAG: DegT/DnrJ/EryC1/StrS family aminotransferase [Rhodocyclaceae bacterium]|nr:DegT/DnrJ/EryC1/StrS family aminotransferase [Rhodocyclaceae bacterium]